jgi:hypothetical protein
VNGHRKKHPHRQTEKLNNNSPNPTAAKALPKVMASQAAESQSALGAPVTVAAAGWLASHYATAAHEKLAGAGANHRWETLRAIVPDLALLRRGGHSPPPGSSPNANNSTPRNQIPGPQKKKSSGNGSNSRTSMKKFSLAKEADSAAKPSKKSKENCV